MDWLLAPESIFEKFLGMFIAIILFVAIMSLILWIIDRPKVPNWLVVVGFLGPVTIALAIGLFYPALSTAYRSFQVSQTALGPDGKADHQSPNRAEVELSWFSAWTTTTRFSPSPDSRRS